MNVTGKCYGSPEMLWASLMRGDETMYEAEGAKQYREANTWIQKSVKKAKEDWIGTQCKEIETCLTVTEHTSWRRI